MRVFMAGRRAKGGFTLVELMIVVVILGILAAIAIPAFSRYVRKSKTAEATTNLAHILTGEVTAYQRSADNDLAHFVSAGPTPSDPPTESKYPPNAALWVDDPSWAELGFSLDTGHYYQYNASVSGRPVLALLLMAGGVVGAQFGASFSARLRAEQFRFALAVLVLLVCLRMAWGLIATPGEPFSIHASQG